MTKRLPLSDASFNVNLIFTVFELCSKPQVIDVELLQRMSTASLPLNMSQVMMVSVSK